MSKNQNSGKTNKTLTLVQDKPTFLIYGTESGGLTCVGMDENALLSLFAKTTPVSELPASRTVEIEPPVAEDDKPKTAPPAPKKTTPAPKDKAAMLARLKELGVKKKGLHLYGEEKLAALLAENETTQPTQPTQPKSEPKQETQPRKQIEETPRKGGGKQGGFKKKSGGDGDQFVEIPEETLWAEFLPKKQRDKSPKQQQWMDVIVLEEKDGGYIVFGPSRDEDAPCPEGWMRGIKWFAQSEFVRFAD